MTNTNPTPEMCETCGGAGGDNQHWVCDKCGGSGRQPRSAPTDIEGMAAAKHMIAMADRTVAEKDEEIASLIEALGQAQRERDAYLAIIRHCYAYIDDQRFCDQIASEIAAIQTIPAKQEEE
jgi:hypothetical protein